MADAPDPAREALAAAEKLYKDLGRRVKDLRAVAGGKAPRGGGGSGYEGHRERMREKQRQASRAARTIGPMPAVKRPELKEACRFNLRLFLETYFPQIFTLAWSDDHLQVIERMQAAVLEGGLFAMAMPRGSGKTSLCECASLWALLYGHRRFVVLIGTDVDSAAEMLDSLRTELKTNELLAGDFPEVCFPIAAMADTNQRKLLDEAGRPIRVRLSDTEIVLPSIVGSDASSGILRVFGITGRIRGTKYKRPDGTAARPDLVILDDPQTDEIARSPSQVTARLRVITGAVLGLAGPGKKISGFMPCTVIQPGDLADTVLDREKHPEWHGIRTKLLYSKPAASDLWARYAKLRAEALRRSKLPREATEFYRDNREEMDFGARVAWPVRFYPDELSGIQHAMNLLFDKGEEVFAAEYQNEPLRQRLGDADLLTADEICAKVNGYKRGEVAGECQHLTAFVDVQAKLLYYLVAAWADDFTGYVIDYGTWPEQQGESYFTLYSATATMALAFPDKGAEAALFAALQALERQLLSREYRRVDGAPLKIGKLLVDANWGWSSPIVTSYARQSPFGGTIVHPSYGRGVGASSRSFADYEQRPGWKIDRDNHWMLPPPKESGARHVIYDTNHWKSFTLGRLRVSPGDSGCLSLWGGESEQERTRATVRHRMLADQFTSEYPVRTEARGRVVDEWKLIPNRDNHLWDCAVGAAVAASMLGAKLPDMIGQRRRGKRLRLSELQAQKGLRR